MSMETTETENRVIALLKEGPMTCTQIGESLWHKAGTLKGIARHRQAYARPAGKIVASLVRKGLVVDHLPGKNYSRRRVGYAAEWRLK